MIGWKKMNNLKIGWNLRLIINADNIDSVVNSFNHDEFEEKTMLVKVQN